MQLPADDPGKAKGNGSEYLGLGHAHMGDLDAFLGSWLQLGPALAFVVIWAVKQ